MKMIGTTWKDKTTNKRVKEQTKLPDAYCCSNQPNGSGQVMLLEPQITGQILSRAGHQQAKENGVGPKLYG